MELLSKVKAGYSGLMSSMSEISALNIKYMEEMTASQMASSKYVADLGFEQLKTVTSIDSLAAAKKLPSSTLEMGTKLAKKTLEDGKSLMATGSSYKADITGIIKKKKAA